MTGPEPVKCATHPDVLTTLRCGKCGKPICPKCLVQTPVGARCRECARLYRLPTFRVSGQYYLRAAGTALGLALVFGLIWGFLKSYLGGFGLVISLLFGYGIGYAIGEITGLAVNRKRGRWLAVIGSLAVVITFGIAALVEFIRFGSFYLSGYPNLITIAAVGFGIYIAANRLR
jgi:hypothetical protein